jgi:hypothetical protein
VSESRGTTDQRRQQLVEQIRQRRLEVENFINYHRPRSQRLGTVSIISSSLAAVLTAGPAVGGDAFTGSMQKDLGLNAPSSVWRVLCIAALIVSITAAVSTNLLRSRDVVTQVSIAEVVATELDGLENALTFGDLPLDAALQFYQQYSTKVAFTE